MSFLNQTYSEFEIIIVDDGSRDNTEEVVKQIKDKRIVYYKKENGERGAARNFGAQKATGDYINFFDSDDIAYSNHLLCAFQLATQRKNPDMFVLNYNHESPDREILKKGPFFYDLNKQIARGNLLSCDGVFIKKTVTAKFPFSEIRALSASEDYFLWLQLASNYTFFHSNEKTSAIVNHEERSVVAINKDSLITRVELLIELISKDSSINNYFGKKVQFMKGNSYSYIALHLAIIKNKQESLKYLFKGLINNPKITFKKRFFVIIKYLLF